MKITQDLLKDLRRVARAVTAIVGLLMVGSFVLIYGLVTEETVADVQQTRVTKSLSEATAARKNTANSDLTVAQVADGIDVATGLRDGTGLSVVKANCLACHSAKLIAQNRFSREVWHKKIVWMQQTQGLWDLGENEPVILDYLAEYYAPEASGNETQLYRRTPLSNIEWYELP